MLLDPRVPLVASLVDLAKCFLGVHAAWWSSSSTAGDRPHLPARGTADAIEHLASGRAGGKVVITV